MKTVENEIKSLGGKVQHIENWGLRKLAYPIQKKSTGFYFLIEFSAPGTLIADFELMMKRDERVIRFLTVRMDDHHATYAEKRKVRLGYKKAEA